MLIPLFSCRQDDTFVIVSIQLPSIHCKVSTAEFDISAPHQFTFYCAPYYLRLNFASCSNSDFASPTVTDVTSGICEGKGERAVYDIGTSTLSVFIPKATTGAVFRNLDVPNILLATRKQQQTIAKRGPLVQVLSKSGSSDENDDNCVDGEGTSSDEDDLETEFVQLSVNPAQAGARPTDGSLMALEKADAPVHAYGFHHTFTGVFDAMLRHGAGAHNDPDAAASYLREVIDIAAPDTKSHLQRRSERLAAETRDFEEDVFWGCLNEGPDGELAEVMARIAPGGDFAPWYITLFESALQRNGVTFLKKAAPCGAYRLPRDVTGDEEGAGSATAQSAQAGQIVAWMGNMGTFVGDAEEPPVKEVVAPSGPQMRDGQEVAGPETRLAVPRQLPRLDFAADEVAMLQFIQPQSAPIVPIPSSAEDVCALIVDLLSAHIFEMLLTSGDGSVESIWTVTKLSPSLSFLDEPRTVFEAMVGFGRRALTYPYIRHWALVDRTLRDVAIVLLCGPSAVMRGLLGLKHVLDTSEHHHLLSKIYLNPLLAYITGCLSTPADTEALIHSLRRTALHIHDVLTFSPASDTVEHHMLDILCSGFPSESSTANDGAGLCGVKAAVMQMLEPDRPRAVSVQVAPFAPFTIGLPIDVDADDDEEHDDEN